MSSFLLYTALLAFVIVDGEPNVVNKKYSNNDKEIGIEFIDISGALTNLIDFEVEVIADGFGFLEGPVWINDYLLFIEMSTNIIYKYEPKTNEISLWHKYEGCGTGLAWNQHFPDELWIACFFGNKILQINMTTFDIMNEYNHKSYHVERDALFQPNDIVIDDKGNVYFTDLPIDRKQQEGARGGVYHINRETKKMTLIQLMSYGPNGISLNNDQSMIVAANCMDVEISKFDWTDYNQYDWDNVYIRAFKKHPAHDPDVALLDEPFYYFTTVKKPYFDYVIHSQYDMLFDGSAFDKDDNLWQAIYFNGQTQGGQISILRNDGNSENDVKYIGTIRTLNPIYSASNLEQANDGFMYATCGNAEHGSLLRYKLKKENKQEL